MTLRTQARVDPSKVLAALEARRRKYASPRTVRIAWGTLSNVLPAAPSDDAKDRLTADAEFARKGGDAVSPTALAMPLANLDDEIRCQFRRMHTLPSHHAPLRGGVSGVVCHRSEEQMCRVDAGRVVAVVTDKQTVRDQTVVQFPGRAMGQQGRTASVELAVSLAGFTGRPHPALAVDRMDGTGTIDLHPESLSDRRARRVRRAGSLESIIVHSAQP